MTTSPPSRSDRRSLRPAAIAIAAFVIAPGAFIAMTGCPGSIDLRQFDGGPASGSGGDNGGSGTGGSMSMVQSCDAPKTVFRQSCASIVCHDAGGVSSLTLTNSDPWSNLYMVPATGDGMGGQCEGMNLVEADAPPAGVLLKRVMGSDCGDKMPMNRASITSTQMTCLTTWINARIAGNNQF